MKRMEVTTVNLAAQDKARLDAVVWRLNLAAGPGGRKWTRADLLRKAVQDLLEEMGVGDE